MRRWGTDRLAATRWAVCALIAALAVANAAFEKTQARGAANLSQAELRPIGDYMRHEIAGGKIPGAIVLVQQHGRPVYFERFRLSRCRSQAADDRPGHRLWLEVVAAVKRAAVQQHLRKARVIADRPHQARAAGFSNT